MSSPPALGVTLELPQFRRRPATGGSYVTLRSHRSAFQQQRIGRHGWQRQSGLQCRRPNDLPRLLSDLEPYREELVGVAVESTYNGYWLVDGLMDHGYAQRRVNTIRKGAAT